MLQVIEYAIDSWQRVLKRALFGHWKVWQVVVVMGALVGGYSAVPFANHTPHLQALTGLVKSKRKSEQVGSNGSCLSSCDSTWVSYRMSHSGDAVQQWVVRLGEFFKYVCAARCCGLRDCVVCCGQVPHPESGAAPVRWLETEHALCQTREEVGGTGGGDGVAEGGVVSGWAVTGEDVRWWAAANDLTHAPAHAQEENENLKIQNEKCEHALPVRFVVGIDRIMLLSH